MALSSISLQFVFAVRCLGHFHPQDDKSSDLTSVVVDAQGEIKPQPSVVRRQENVATAQSSQMSDTDECNYPVEDQMVRIAMTNYAYKPKDLEVKIDNFPKWLKWTDLNMKKCGWEMKLWECVAPCNKKDHDQLIVAYNKDGNGGVKPKTCVISFTGRDDNVESRAGIGEWYGIKPDRKLWKANGKVFDPSTSKVMVPWTASVSGKALFSAKFHTDDYANYKSATIWSTFETMVTNGTCENLIVTGHSNGGAAAQMFHADKADMFTSGDSKDEFKSTCFGGKTNCTSVLFSPVPAFTKNAPKFADCTGNFMISAKEDAAPRGISSPPGPEMDEYEEVYGPGSAYEVNVPLGVKRVYLENHAKIKGFKSVSSVKAVSKGCESNMIENGALQKFQRFVISQAPPRMENGLLTLLYMPWHFTPYVIFMVDAWSQDKKENFFTNTGAVVYFALYWSYLQKETEGFADNKDGGQSIEFLTKGEQMLQEAVDEMLSIDGLFLKPGEDDQTDNVSAATKAKVLAAAEKMRRALDEKIWQGMNATMWQKADGINSEKYLEGKA